MTPLPTHLVPEWGSVDRTETYWRVRQFDTNLDLDEEVQGKLKKIYWNYHVDSMENAFHDIDYHLKTSSLVTQGMQNSWGISYIEFCTLTGKFGFH
jgi:hypothetical protein